MSLQSKKRRKLYKEAGAIAQCVGHLPCTQQTHVRSLAYHKVPHHPPKVVNVRTSIFIYTDLSMIIILLFLIFDYLQELC